MIILFAFVGAILAGVTVCRCQGIELVALNRENIYEYEGSVSVNAQTPWDQINLKPPQTAGWKLTGRVKLQRINDQTLAASVRTLNNNLIMTIYSEKLIKSSLDFYGIMTKCVYMFDCVKRKQYYCIQINFVADQIRLHNI